MSMRNRIYQSAAKVKTVFTPPTLINENLLIFNELYFMFIIAIRHSHFHATKVRKSEQEVKFIWTFFSERQVPSLQSRGTESEREKQVYLAFISAPTRYDSVGCDDCRFIGTKEYCLQSIEYLRCKAEVRQVNLSSEGSPLFQEKTTRCTQYTVHN